MDRFQLLISSSKVDLAFFARMHRQGDAFSASYHSLQADVIGISFLDYFTHAFYCITNKLCLALFSKYCFHFRLQHFSYLIYIALLFFVYWSTDYYIYSYHENIIWIIYVFVFSITLLHQRSSEKICNDGIVKHQSIWRFSASTLLEDLLDQKCVVTMFPHENVVKQTGRSMEIYSNVH